MRYAGNIWEWRVTVATSSAVEVVGMARLLDFGWPDMTAPLVGPAPLAAHLAHPAFHTLHAI